MLIYYANILHTGETWFPRSLELNEREKKGNTAFPYNYKDTTTATCKPSRALVSSSMLTVLVIFPGSG